MELFKYYMIIYVYTINLYMLCNVSPAHTHTPGPQLVLDTHRWRRRDEALSRK